MIVLIFVCSPTNNNYNLFCYFLITMTYFNSSNYHAIINCYCYMYCCVYIVVVVIVVVLSYTHIIGSLVDNY